MLSSGDIENIELNHNTCAIITRKSNTHLSYSIITYLSSNHKLELKTHTWATIIHLSYKCTPDLLPHTFTIIKSKLVKTTWLQTYSLQPTNLHSISPVLCNVSWVMLLLWDWSGGTLADVAMRLTCRVPWVMLLMSTERAWSLQPTYIRSWSSSICRIL